MSGLVMLLANVWMLGGALVGLVAGIVGRHGAVGTLVTTLVATVAGVVAFWLAGRIPGYLPWLDFVAPFVGGLIGLPIAQLLRR